MMTEPLEESAPLAERLAARHCRPGGAGDGGCGWYHGSVQYMRLLGLIASPAVHHDFFADALRPVIAAGGRRVLISGAADTAMPAQVLGGFRGAGAEAEMTLVDLCETPLQLNRWFMNRLSGRLETQVSDMLGFVSAEPFDVLCTHCFLGYFEEDERTRLFARWRELLRPGGRVVTVQPIREGLSAPYSGFTREQAAAFAGRARDAAATAGLPELSPGRAHELAAAFAAHFRSIPVRSGAALRHALEQAGFAVERMTPLPGPPPGKAGAGPTESGVGYTAIVLVRL